MSARERLTETLRNPGLVGLDGDEAAELIDAFAHELAERQRDYAREVGVPLEDGDIVSAGDVIDLIDPRVGPVRQDGGAHREAPIDLAEAQRLAEGHASALTELYGRLRQAGHAYASNSAFTASEAADELAKQLRDDRAKLPVRPDEEKNA